MNARKTIGALEMVTLGGTVIGEVKGGHAMPRPASLGAVFLFYGLLGIASETGDTAARISSAIAFVVTLAALVTGTAGKNILSLLDSATRFLAGSSTSTPGGSSPASPPGSSGPI